MILGVTDSILASICLSIVHPNIILESPQTRKSSFVALWQQIKEPIFMKWSMQSLTTLLWTGTRLHMEGWSEDSFSTKVCKILYSSFHAAKYYPTKKSETKRCKCLSLVLHFFSCCFISHWLAKKAAVHVVFPRQHDGWLRLSVRVLVGQVREGWRGDAFVPSANLLSSITVCSSFLKLL